MYVCTGVHVIVKGAESVLDLPPSGRTLVVRDTDSRLAYLGRIEDTMHKDSALPQPTREGQVGGY